MSNLPLFKKFVNDMFRLMSLNLLVVGFICVFNSCQSNYEEDKPLQADKSILERFAIAKEIANYHSEGLKFVYNQLKGQKSILQMGRDVKNEFIQQSVAEYMSEEKIQSRISQFENQICLEKQDVFFRSGNQEPPETLIFFISVMENITDENAIEPIIEQALASDKFNSFSEAEQNEVLLMLAVFMDSVDYWSENLEDWNDLKNVTSNFRSGEVTNAGGGEIVEDVRWKYIFVTGLVDAIGGSNGAIKEGLIGAAGGAGGGALGGILFGGLGAGPGAFVGGVSCGVGGMISGYINGAINASSGYVVVYGDED